MVARLATKGVSGEGGVLRDSSGVVLFGFSTPLGELTCIQAEIKSLLFGVQQCLLRGFLRIQVKVDSLVLVNILLRKSRCPWLIRLELDALVALQGLEWTVGHCYREANQVTDALAKEGARSEDTVLYSSPADLPRLARGALGLDRSQTPSIRIASHPNIYVLDTPGILPPEIFGDELCSKLALIGAIRDCIVGKNDLAHYFLAVLNLSQEYKKWSRFSAMENVRSSIYQEGELSESSHVDKRQYATDHTQDFIVNDVRRTLFEAVSTFSGDLENDKYLEQLIEVESRMLRNAFRITQSEVDGHTKVAIKLLDLYRTGRLGHYVLDDIPRIS
ncbi:DAR GTPase 2, mitochondrial-like [Coffea eugenioides]|uniref:DAR GTPase 2, mitochondrial-like n=1 Tax=Coffea eugenioides TaxID=49369 RepID=UPI000F615521|nr:DAR GTPase 2, mitochondrial-like [Coffea eugenioides]